MNVYDKRGSGFIPGEGCGFVSLKRLDDARADGDFVYAVIRGWGVSSDGSGGITAPRADSQAKMIERAYARAGYSPHELAFIEGHGTATVAGDRAELEGIHLALQTYGDAARRSVGMTSFKSLIGHTKAASGMAGFIKTTLAVNRRVIPPFAGCKVPNPIFAQTAHELYPVLRGTVRDPAATIRAGASAMGFGGINCHIALESGDEPAPAVAPSIDERVLMVSAQDTEVFPFSAPSVDELRNVVSRVVSDAGGASVAELTDLAAHVANAIDPSHAIRAAVVAGRPDELVERLQELETILTDLPPSVGDVVANPKGNVVVANAVRVSRVGFLFPGQGSQQLEMARTLVERYDWARELVRQADEWVREAAGRAIGESIYRPLDRAVDRTEIDEWSAALARTEVAQPAICLASLLWLRRLERLGLRPAAVAGHSLGELTAFHAADAFDERTLLTLAAIRGGAMAAPTESAGAMAALGCDRERAEALVERANGYVVLANINSPTQVVVSGDRAAVEEVAALAAEEEIQARVLAVSNAFHSARVEDAAARLRADAPVPETMPYVDVLLLSGVDGKPVEPGTDLRTHFANQVLAQVDFVSVTQTLAETCDVLVEVGPGAVLSGLVRATVGEDGPPCLPVASSPAADEDLNVALGQLFARGVDIRWDELYAGRLVRPFVPASELAFIENPVELPLEIPDAPAGGLVGAAGDPLLAEVSGLSEAELSDYLARRGVFLGQVIRADLGAPAPLAAHDGQPSEAVATGPPTASDARIESRLVELAAELTGFPAESIPATARLLDDLNLDSIKAAELVTRAADEYGAGELDLGPLANGTLDEVAAAIRNALPVGGGADAQSVLLELVAESTGFPANTLSLDLRLLDDLNLDSIKAAELVLEAAGRLGVPEENAPEPSMFANATLGEVAAALAGTGETRRVAGDTSFENRPSWVRDFVVEWVEEPAEQARVDLGGAKVLVAFDGDKAPATAIGAAFEGNGASVALTQFADEGARTLYEDETLTHVIAMLPRHADPSVAVRRAVDRLQLLTGAPGAKRTLVFIQFGGGRGGTMEPFPSIDQSCALAFAASVHHERPDLRVRVIDADPRAEPGRLADHVLAELASPEPFVAAGYDEDGVRHVPRPRIDEPGARRPRQIAWTEDDVVLATGGAKGITAECALALAKRFGVKLALVGSSAPPTAADGGEIAATLERCQREGIACRYYQCDVVDSDAVADLVARVGADLGKVTGVIHGAGANVPRRAEQVPAEAAAAEVGPKVLGVMNLCRALDAEPPKLFIGFSSITGVTGMPGNSWYGFANEALELTLRRFKFEHRETAVLSLAFSIWGEVGMGARMGSADQLAKMGVAAIPTDEGVRRFLHLVEHEPLDSRVVVAARLRGLDTWRPAQPSPPTADRFLEDVVHAEPGVEVVTRARLTLERDDYLRDHVYQGSHLLPTVFGLEAMAQAAALTLGLSDLGTTRIEDVELERPVVVDPEQGAEIEIRTEVLERAGPERIVRAAIGTDKTGFTTDHFSARFVVGATAADSVERIDAASEPLDIKPEEDLYGRLLFQGLRFQRLVRVHQLDSRECVLVAREEQPDGRYVLGDPFFRDALLHGAQLVVPQSICLPVRIGAIEIRPRTDGGGDRLVRIVNEGRVDDYENARLVAVDGDGHVLERLDGFRLRILERRENNPTAEEIADPSERDAAVVRQTLHSHAARLGVRAPEPAFAYLGDLHALSTDERHEREEPLFRAAASAFLENGGDAP